MIILTRLRHAAEQCRYWRRRRQISQYSTTNGLFSGTSHVLAKGPGVEQLVLLVTVEHIVDRVRRLEHLAFPLAAAALLVTDFVDRAPQLEHLVHRLGNGSYKHLP